MSIATILGMSVFLGIIAYFVFQLRNADDSLEGGRANHFILQLILIFFLFSGLFVMSSQILLESQDCSWEVNNTYDIYIYGNYFGGYHWEGYNATAPSQVDRDAFLFHKNVTNDYEYFCNESSGPSNTFFKLSAWLMRIISIYIFLYFVYEVLRYFGFITPKEGS